MYETLIKFYRSEDKKTKLNNHKTKLFYGVIPKLIFISLGLFSLTATTIAQGRNPPVYRSNFTHRKAFRQEIARLEITVERKGQTPLPMTMVPRVRKDDLIKVRMLDEPINGIRPDESFWNWTLAVAFVNPSRNKKEEEAVSREIHFKQDGWYREHLFKVPYDSQPVFFLYPKPKYRKKIKKLINKNFTQIRKIGEKTLEIAGAYAHISMFLNELQEVINRDQYRGFNNYNFGRNNQNNDVFFRNEIVERLAQSFNIRLPNCWDSRGRVRSNSNNFVNRAQCVARNVRLEDFDVSIGKMIQQGGLFAATRLIEKFPQLAYWINVAALAIDFILKVTRKSPLRIIPTIASTQGNNRLNNRSRSNRSNNLRRPPPTKKIRLYAEKPPTDIDFVTAFPIVLHKWQPEPDPEVISLPIPSLMEPCLHIGQNILKNTDITYDWLRDPFARDFRLIMSAENGFSKEFYLTKNVGMSGWQLMLNQQDLRAFPKVKMKIESKIVATRGFNQIESKKFILPLAGGGTWEIPTNSLNKFSIGGKRRITIKNTMGNTGCLESVKYKPSFGGEFTFTANSNTNPLKFSLDGGEAWFDIDTTHFKPGQGTLEFRTYGSRQPQNIRVKLYPSPPEITKLNAHKGDNKIYIEGKRINQIKSLTIEGKKARPINLKRPPNNSQTNGAMVFIFQNRNDLILSKNVSIKLQLDAGRTFTYPNNFPVRPARPAIYTAKNNEIEAVVINSTGKSTPQFDLSKYPIASVDTQQMYVAVKTILTDYDFKTENLSIETKIENGQVGRNALPRTKFEVLDPANLKINFLFNGKYQQFLAGRRLQFRIKDKIRGNSNWHTIKQTFVRTPTIDSINCLNEKCKITGKGLDYIGQISIDGGKVWLPPLQVQSTPDGISSITISGVKDKDLLRIKLRDFPNTEGLVIK